MGIRIVVVVGSLRRESINRKLAHAMEALAPADFNFGHARIDDLPLYNQDDDGTPCAAVQRLKGEIAAADGVMFVTPEYNRGLPGVFKNALDHASRPYGKSAWTGKPAGILGASIGQIGTAVAQAHLRAVLGYLDMPTLGQPEVYLKIDEGFFDAEGGIASDRTRRFLQGWMDRFAEWVRLHARQ